jgi:hypothetical protein
VIGRRDFLRFRAHANERVAELDGQALFMRSQDARLTHRTDDDGAVHAIAGSADWLDSTVADLKRRLADASVVRVVGREWLVEGPLATAVDEVLAAVRARGGRITGSH